MAEWLALLPTIPTVVPIPLSLWTGQLVKLQGSLHEITLQYHIQHYVILHHFTLYLSSSGSLASNAVGESKCCTRSPCLSLLYTVLEIYYRYHTEVQYAHYCALHCTIISSLTFSSIQWRAEVDCMGSATPPSFLSRLFCFLVKNFRFLGGNISLSL